MLECRASWLSATRKLGQRTEQNRNGCIYEFNLSFDGIGNALSRLSSRPKNLKIPDPPLQHPHLISSLDSIKLEALGPGRPPQTPLLFVRYRHAHDS